MSEPRQALICGASGLVGRECLRLLCDSETYGNVKVLTRRDLGNAVNHPKAEQIIVDFDRLEMAGDQLFVDDVFCALGTTIRKAGSKRRFQEIDFGYPLRVAELTLDRGARQFALVSSLGATPNSIFFYSRVKGNLERALRAQNWERLIIVQPSIIGGDRDEPRPLERLGQRILSVAPRTWRTVSAAHIARAMVRAAERSETGITVIPSREIWSA